MKFFRLSLFLLALWLLASCGMSGPGGTVNSEGTPSCTPNIIDSGMQVKLEPLSEGSNTYALTLCTRAQPSDAVYSVYGGPKETEVTRVRVGNVYGSTSAGSKFQVTFYSTDNYFAIYQDRPDGSFDNSKVLISPHRIPGR